MRSSHPPIKFPAPSQTSGDEVCSAAALCGWSVGTCLGSQALYSALVENSSTRALNAPGLRCSRATITLAAFWKKEQVAYPATVYTAAPDDGPPGCLLSLMGRF